jgi:hypothetical protein
MPSRNVLLASRHSPWRSLHRYTGVLSSTQEACLTADRLLWAFPLLTSIVPAKTTAIIMVERNSTALCISLRPFQPALDTSDEIKVLIEGGWGGELISSKISGWIAYTRALRPIFVSTRARQGASSGRTARTAILGNVNVTCWRRVSTGDPKEGMDNHTRWYTAR